MSKDDVSQLSQEAAFEYAKKALPMMARHGVKPTPNNYAIWYTYIAGNVDDLNHEIETIINEAMAFSDDINEYLYTKYIAEHDNQIVQETTIGARKLLAEIMGAVSEFTGETQHYQDDLNQHITDAEKDLETGNVKGIAEKIISSAISMKASGENFSDKLDESKKEIEQLKEKLARVTTESEKDFLTGVYNRKALDKKLEEAIQEAREEEADLCILMIDIDHFKLFNDQYGHLIGDEVLKIVSKTLISMVKGKDVVARYGGEEFAILLPHTPIGGAMVVADMIRKNIATKELKRKDTGEAYGQITVSIGVAMYRLSKDTVPTFLKRADDALYRSKNSGRNCVTQESLGGDEDAA